MDTEDRFRGCLLGLAIGDAVGTTLEFKPPGSFKPITGMAGGTTAAICGQLAGAFYGESGIPKDWLEKLAMRQEITNLAESLLAANPRAL